MYMKKMKAQVRKRYMHTYLFADICNSQDMKQPECRSLDEWMKKMPYIYMYIWEHIYIMEYYLAKRNEILPFVIWMDLEGIILTEISQTGKDTCCMISLSMWNLKHKNEQTEQKQKQELQIHKTNRRFQR